MQIELVKPFLEATINVIDTMAQTKVTPGKPSLKKDIVSWGDVTGIIGMAGDDVSGNLMLSFDKSSIISIVNKMLMESFNDITPDVVDAVGELTNMVSGGAKRTLIDLGYKIEMATPMTLVGKGVQITQTPINQPIFVIPFTTEQGAFVVEASLSKKTKL